MKMTIRLTFMEMKKRNECRICFRPPPFLIVEHNYCSHQSSICMDCFQKWFHCNGHCDLCRKKLFPKIVKFYIVKDEQIKIYYHKKIFLESLRDVKKKDLEIIKDSMYLFQKNFNLIEQYEFKSTKKKDKRIFFVKIFNKDIFPTLKLYLLLCKFNKKEIQL